MRQILVFSLLNEVLGLDISCVREVMKLRKIHPIPNAPDFIEGVINLRCRIITILNLEELLTIDEATKLAQIRN